MFVFAAFLLLGVASCNGERTYKADGEYTAFSIDLHRGAPMVTEVTVTIEDDEIVGYYIDALQSSLVEGTDGDGNPTYAYEWNAETKKELGDDYGMVDRGGASAEWYVQAERIEAFWLENGYDAVTVDDDNVIDNVTGVTIKDGGYTDLAAEAVQQAIDGVFKSYTVSEHYNGTANVIFATMEVDENGDPISLELDTLQSTIDTTGENPTLVWNEETKQELGDDYGMVERGGATYEWFEQANMITDYLLANGWEDGFTVQDVDSLSDVTITTSYYEVVLEDVYAKLG